jgi:hypothetical protein
MATFLRAAEVIEDRGDVIVVELPPGPGLERLVAEPTIFEAVRGALSNELGRAVMLELRQRGGVGEPATGRDGAGPARITPEKVKSDQLSRLAQSRPAYGSAVREWDLELPD